ncbi:putative sulfate exporter family transporter [Undibacterium sp. CY18W]|uniref:Sulfate exporter family transporter n=1 Tax=Undibacterium hunanense TaxID=2762292 RepID=A0ABR6ZP67_9BURK|nr:putative sulfate exporter family transporter [Undibacterium hunanense]MBC3917280.1 putative sulfate exporter family transporter [Undibacterium hunanense]
MIRQKLYVLRAALPGLALCTLVTACAYALEGLESAVFGRAWLESLVLAILQGTGIRTFYRLDARFEPGIQAGAKLLLEIAVLLLGATVSASSLFENGAELIVGIAAVVAIVIMLSFIIGRSFGLPRKMAILIACGNSICGNSAIAAVAPVIDADGEDVAAAIAFTAVLGVVVVLVLPLLISVLSFSPLQFGVFAGLTVYAVPQVLAATGAVSLGSVHIGTLVKLVRVLMLGPVVLVLSLLGRNGGARRPSLSHMVPWFIVGFLLLMSLRSLRLIPEAAIAPAHVAANFFTIMSMAALGLGVDARSVMHAGGRVAAVVILSLLVLAAVSFALIKLLGIG